MINKFQPMDPDFATRVKNSFAKQKIMEHLGAKIATVEPGICIIELPFKEELAQQHGFFHGGVIGTIADSAAGYAGFSLMPKNAAVLTVEYKMNIMSPGDGELLIAKGEVIKPGRTLTIAKADVWVVKESKKTLCATMLQTLIARTGDPEFIG